MRIETLVAAAGLAVASVGCGAAAPQQTRATELQCAGMPSASESAMRSLLSGAVTRAEPIHYERFYAGGPQPDHVVGARLYVPATAGESEAHLERALACHAGSTRAAGLPEDPLGVDGVRSVAVRSSGASFEISVLGRDQQSGEAIWQRARSLAGDVGVRQLAATDATAAF